MWIKAHVQLVDGQPFAEFAAARAETAFPDLGVTVHVQIDCDGEVRVCARRTDGGEWVGGLPFVAVE